MPQAEIPSRQWQASPFAPLVNADLVFAPEVRLTDCTLRDGEQQAGVVFTRKDKLQIARLLDQSGVYEIEAGTPVVSLEDRLALEDIVAEDLNARISALARARRDDIDLVAECGAWGVRLSLPISPIQRASKLDLSDDQYLALALEMSAYAKGLGLACIFSPYDTTRCELPFLRRVLAALAKEGTVDRVRLVDTTGCATPEIIRFLVDQMRDAGGMPIEVHCHDDFGLAVANTLAGAAAGAQYLSVTVNGIGERCGNASFEEVALALQVLYDVSTNLDTKTFVKLSRLVEELSGIRVQDHKAVVGRGSFAHESGMVVAGLLKDPFSAETYIPELVGQVRRIVLGKMSGIDSVKAKLAALSIQMDDAKERSLLKWIKEEAVRIHGPVSDDAFKARVEKMVRPENLMRVE